MNKDLKMKEVSTSKLNSRGTDYWAGVGIGIGIAGLYIAAT